MRILAVCGMGLGSSLVLKMNIEKVMDQEGIKGTVDVKDLSSIQGEKADFIFASEEIGKKIDHPAEVISVKNMTDRNEIKEKVLTAAAKLSK
ncbi:PTS sugar transporter subunit IIB [Halanaerobium salsuginis]|uniref:PTS system IIB component, L-Asc family n=1 Tax=Halanaerobium salsuginis TaxID=29563 RepID=A0A1I4HGC6_9FIRM|nr:PTS sugar transporter subunit IIB [Halanaerobium salsuginis]SFL41358.1 PTS system IIB component, L-Asc family [Halanaerobium salsuginis]